MLALGTLLLTTRCLPDKFGRDVSSQFQWSGIRLHEVECLKIAKSFRFQFGNVQNNFLQLHHYNSVCAIGNCVI